MHAIRGLVPPLLIASVVVPCLAAAAAAASKEIVSEVSVFPLKAVLQATASGDPGNLPPALLARAKMDYIAWFVEHITPLDPTVATALRGGHSHYPIEFVMVEALDAFDFHSSLGTVRFERTKCALWDCYKDYLSLLDAKGKPVWRRRISAFQCPVPPYEVGGRLLFLASKNGRTMLFSLNLRSGKISKPFAPEQGVSLDGLGLSDYYPYFIDGYVCAAEEDPGLFDGQGIEQTKSPFEPRVFVMKLRE